MFYLIISLSQTRSGNSKGQVKLMQSLGITPNADNLACHLILPWWKAAKQ